MKTREQLYGQEATAILRDISMYHVLTEEQILRLHPGDGTAHDREKIASLLHYLVKQDRVWHEEESPYYTDGPDAKPDRSLLAAVWVLADFIDQVEFHSAGDYPAKIIFFADGEVYEIVHAAQGKEVLVSLALSGMGVCPSRYLVLVDDPAQIEGLELPNACGYCTVSPEGEVHYYRREVNDTT